MPEETEKIDFLNSERVQRLKAQIKQAEDDNERLKIINQLFNLIQRSSKSVVDQLQSGVNIENFDEVKATLANEFRRNTKTLFKALKDLSLSVDQQADIMASLMARADKREKDQFQTIMIKKEAASFDISNLHEIDFPKQITVDNIPQVISKLEEIRKAFKVPAPQVTVKPPQVNVPKITIPEIKVPQPLVEVKSDFEPLLKAIKTLNEEIRDTRDKLTEDQLNRLENISQAVSQGFAGFPGKVRLDAKSSIAIKSQKGIVSGSVTVTTAGTAVRITTTKTACQYIIVSSDENNTGGLTFAGGSNVDATAGSQVGIPIPGPAGLRIDIDDVSKLYFDAQSNGDKISYAYFTA